MWEYINPDELYHSGVLGMRWGRRKRKSSELNKKKEFKNLKKQEDYNKLVKDNDDRVKTYGKDTVKTVNRIGIAATAYTGLVFSKMAFNMGKRSLDKIKNQPISTNKIKGTEAMTLGAIGIIGGLTLRQINKYHNDNKMADNYEYRQYLKKNKINS